MQTVKITELLRKKIEIDRPFLIKKYDHYMGEADQLDNYVSNCRIALKDRKGYKPRTNCQFGVCLSIT